MKVCHVKVYICDFRRQNLFSLKQLFGKSTTHIVAMEQTADPGFRDANVKILKKMTVNVTESNKCKQCDYASFQASHLRTHLKTHRGEKSNKCNQCDYASSEAGNLRRHLKTHNGIKSNKCDQCNFATAHVSALKTHLNIATGETS